MSGHSKWSKIKRDKGANDAKRGAIFTKLGNQIAIAARGGVDPDLNSTLAMAIEKAKAANMPVSNIQRAIDRVADKNSADLQEITYEGYGPGGVGIIIETATDNRNRTLPEVKTALVKNGGSIADAGSVSFQFDRKGVIRVGASGEDALLTILDAGAEDAVEEDGEIISFLDHATHLVDASVKRYIDRGFTNLMVSFGCTGGQHRSVYSAQYMAKYINEKFGIEVNLIHREQNKEQHFAARKQ